jgi:hypothetical protein
MTFISVGDSFPGNVEKSYIELKLLETEIASRFCELSCRSAFDYVPRIVYSLAL